MDAKRRMDAHFLDLGLCDDCKALDIKNWLHPPFSSDPYKAYPIKNHWAELSSVLQRRESCFFCRCIIESLSLDSRFAATVNLQTEQPLTISLWPTRVGHVKHLISHDEVSQMEETSNWVQFHDAWYRTVYGMLIMLLDSNYEKLYADGNLRVLAGGSIGANALLAAIEQRETIDLMIARKWVTKCQQDHADECSRSRSLAATRATIRLIDVQDKCVVTTQSMVPYFALSYCWGDPQTTKRGILLSTITKQDLYIKGSLESNFEALPTTISDAIWLTNYFGERYLWVDALCIIQDDDDDKLVQIKQMDKVYRNARLTIVAAGGNNAWSGLSGLEQHPRNFRQTCLRSKEFAFEARRPCLDYSDLLVNSSWASRAWTYQEYVLSPRLLIFTDYELLWECRCKRWREGFVWETNSSLISLENHIGYQSNVRPSLSLNAFQRYNSFVSAISRRNIRYESDRLNSMQGFFEDLSYEMTDGFIWGLSVNFLESSLLFHGGVFAKLSSDAPYPRIKEYPSWSWLGWRTSVLSSICGPYDSGFSDDRADDHTFFDGACPRDASLLRKEVAFFRIDEGEIKWLPVSSSHISEEGSYFIQESRRRWQGLDPVKTMCDVTTTLNESKIPLSHALVFWGQIVYLSVDRTESSDGEKRGFGNTSGRGYTVRNSSGRNLCYVQMSEEDRANKPDKVQFLMTSHNLRWAHKAMPFFDLLYVETCSGITTRLQVVRDSMVDLATWLKENPQWELIVMV